VEAVKVPQYLELEDVVAWGLGAADLLCAMAGAVVGWWLYLTLPGDAVLRVIAATFVAVIGLAFGVVRIGEVALRDWLAMAAAYALRPRVFVTGGRG
jgi:hypothetical protein